jgi:site-specific recombinase XerC
VDGARDLGTLVVPRVGSLAQTEDLFEPYRLMDPAGLPVAAVAVFLAELAAGGRSAATQRSSGMALLRWFRFLWAIGMPWDQATRVEARDFARWVQFADKPPRPHWRTGIGSSGGAEGAGPPSSVTGAVNPVTGKRAPGRVYAPTTVAHGESVLRSFYAHHLECGSGPIVNPFPLVARGRRTSAHHNPMDPFPAQRSGLYRPRVPRRVPRQIPEEMFNRLFARLGSHRDRALVAFWISTGARAAELLGVTASGADPGQQLITVVRKGSRALQALPASPDAFVWLRLYQQQMHGLVPARGDDPLWWTLRRPFRPLTYPAARAMFGRANAALGANWSLHDLRHSAAYRLARDPLVPITDVQWVLGHAHLSTIQPYITPMPADVIEDVLAHHRRRTEQKTVPASPPSPSYRPESLAVLFGSQR